MPTSPKRRPAELDDESNLELPPSDGGEELGNFEPDDDSDLRLDTDQAGEQVGLDTAAGPEEAMEAELMSFVATGLGSDTEPSEDLEAGDGELIQGAETGWLVDNDPPDAEDFSTDVGLSEAPVGPDDGGQDGFASGGEDDSMPPLPPLDSDGDEDLEETAALAAEILAEATREQGPWKGTVRLAAARDRLFHALRRRNPATLAAQGRAAGRRTTSNEDV